MAAAAAATEALCRPLGVEPPLHGRRLRFFKHNRAFCIAKARSRLGYEPQVDVEQGFRRTADWYRSQGLLARRNQAQHSEAPGGPVDQRR